jgi:hypothetical protein
LDDGDPLADIDDLPGSELATLRRRDLDELPVADTADALQEEERPRDLPNREVSAIGEQISSPPWLYS